MRLKVNGERIETSPQNTILFQFAGDLAMRNFVYIDGEESFARVWEHSSNGDLYKRLAKLAVDEHYPIHTNMQWMEEDDRKAYDDMAVADVARLNSVPIAWQKAH